MLELKDIKKSERLINFNELEKGEAKYYNRDIIYNYKQSKIMLCYRDIDNQFHAVPGNSLEECLELLKENVKKWRWKK